MISRKKRLRYKSNAIRIAKENNISINPDSWEEIWNILDQYEEPTYLYAIGDSSNQMVKLGKSKNPGYRLKQLQTGTSVELILFGFCKESSPLTEKEVHKLLKADRLSGEWFKMSEVVRQTITRIREG
jgi:hypothetical protein